LSIVSADAMISPWWLDAPVKIIQWLDDI
jgi:hypothetical protein